LICSRFISNNFAATDANAAQHPFRWNPDTVVAGQTLTGAGTDDYLLGNAGADTLSISMWARGLVVTNDHCAVATVHGIRERLP
jgi:hypothetical protein